MGSEGVCMGGCAVVSVPDPNQPQPFEAIHAGVGLGLGPRLSVQWI